MKIVPCYVIFFYDKHVNCYFLKFLTNWDRQKEHYLYVSDCSFHMTA